MMTKRLIDFYQKHSPGSENTLSSIWSGIVQVHHAGLRSALQASDSSALQALLDGHGGMLHGLEMSQIYVWGSDGASHLLNRLARRVGILPVQNPEQPSPSVNWNSNDLAWLKSELEKVLGPLGVPNGFVFPCTDTGVPIMHFFKLGQWFTVQSLMNPAPVRVLEIGAGTGGLALVAYNNGVRNYTIIDIPSVAVLSAYYLSKVYGEDKVWLLGENPNENAVGRWFPHNAYEGAKGEYDLIVNCNSFPEMTIENQDGYMRFIEECLSPNGLFFSVNHESDLASQSRVSAAVQRNGSLKIMYRAPSMMRDGYLEEFYRRK